MKFLQDEQLAQITAEMTDAVIVGGGGMGYCCSSSSAVTATTATTAASSSLGGSSSSSGGGTVERLFQGRIEAFIMKRAKNDKKVAYRLSEKLVEDVRVADLEYASFQQTLMTAATAAVGHHPTPSTRPITTATSHREQIHPNKEKKKKKKKRSSPSTETSPVKSVSVLSTAPPPPTTTTISSSSSLTGGASSALDGIESTRETYTHDESISSTVKDAGVIPLQTATDTIPSSSSFTTTTTHVPLAPILKKSRSLSTASMGIGPSTSTTVAITIPPTFGVSSSFSTRFKQEQQSSQQQHHHRKRSASFDTTKPRSSSSSVSNNYRNHSFSSSSSSSLRLSTVPLGDLHQSCNRKLMTDLILTLNASFPDYDFTSTRPSSFIHYTNIHGVIQEINDKLSEFNYSHRMNSHRWNHHPSTTTPNTSSSGLLHTNTNKIISSTTMTPQVLPSPRSPFLSIYYPSMFPSWLPTNTTSVSFSSWTMNHHFSSTNTTAMTIFPTTTTTTTSSSISSNDFLFRFWNAIDQVIQLQECEIYSYSPPRIQEDDDPMDFLIQSSSSSSTSNVPLWTMNYFFVNKIRKRIVFFTCVSSMRPLTSTISSSGGGGGGGGSSSSKSILPMIRNSNTSGTNIILSSTSNNYDNDEEEDYDDEDRDYWNTNDDDDEEEEEEGVGVSSLLYEEGRDMDEDSDEEYDVDGDYDMDDCMIQAVSAPTL